MLLKIYKSSAGSGKTFTLVKEYLKLCLPYPDRFKYISALTFTNAAAAEMKGRVLKTLKNLANGGSPEMKDLLLKEGITQQQLGNVPVLLEKILYNYSYFNISTIDSFFHKIVRSFNKELGIAYDFELSIDSSEAMDYAVERFLQKSSEEPEIHKMLIAFIREKIGNGQSWNVSEDLYRIAKELLKDNPLPVEDTDITSVMDFIGELKKILLGFEDKMDQIASGILSGIQELGLEIGDFKYGKAGAFSFIIKSLKANREYDPGSRFLAGLNDDFEWYKKNDPNLRLIEEALNTFLRAGALELFELYESGYRDYASAREVLKNIYTFSVYQEINKMFDAYRAEKNVVLVSDFTRILARHLKNEDISYIYSKIGSRLDHFLIDEFQDTSSLQWASIKPLVENAVSQGYGCLVVGDSKQAIYRWRGGTVELIERQLAEIDFPAYAERQHLIRNFRSRQAIVDFNNLFFKNMPALFPGETDEYTLLNQIFTDAAQQSRDDFEATGYVEVNFIPKPGRGDDSFMIPAGKKLLSQIEQSVQDGYFMKDITILVRDKKDALAAANLLHSHHIPFITHDSLQLQHSPAVRLLLGLITWFNAPEDLLSKTEIAFLYQYYYNQGEANARELLDQLSIDCFALLPAAFSDHTDKLAHLPIYELVEELILIFGINAPDAYLQRFQDAVLEYVLTENGSRSGFIDWWEKGNFTVIQPENQDAIQIMTIHKSKGLEFPVVIIPYADWDFNSGKPNMLWVNPSKEPFNSFPVLPVNYGSGLKASIFENDYIREEALISIDNLNLLYVAFTRAKDRLYINTQSVKNAPIGGIKTVPQLMDLILNPPKMDTHTDICYGNAVASKPQAAPGIEESTYISLDEYIVTSRL